MSLSGEFQRGLVVFKARLQNGSTLGGGDTLEEKQKCSQCFHRIEKGT